MRASSLDTVLVGVAIYALCHVTDVLLGNLTGPMLFKPKDAPTYAPGFIVVLATSIAAGVLAIVYRLVCIRENRDRGGSKTQDGPDSALADVGDRQNSFNYVL
jgi:hypothetical protein